MKFGHRYSDRKQSAKDSEWYRQIEEENIRKIEAEWQAKQSANQPKQGS